MIIDKKDAIYDDLSEILFDEETDCHPQEDSVIAQEIWEQIEDENLHTD